MTKTLPRVTVELEITIIEHLATVAKAFVAHECARCPACSIGRVVGWLVCTTGFRHTLTTTPSTLPPVQIAPGSNVQRLEVFYNVALQLFVQAESYGKTGDLKNA